MNKSQKKFNTLLLQARRECLTFSRLLRNRADGPTEYVQGRTSRTRFERLHCELHNRVVQTLQWPSHDAFDLESSHSFIQSYINMDHMTLR